MEMLAKGVVVALPAEAPLASADDPAIQRIANRPIVCHAVEGLVGAGVTEVAVVMPATAGARLRPCIEENLSDGIRPVFLRQTGRMDLLGALAIAAEFVGDAAAVVHFADGLLGQPLSSVIPGHDAEEPDLRLVLHRSDDARERLGAVAERLLGVTELNGSCPRLALAGVAFLGPGRLRSIAAAAKTLGPHIDLIGIAEHLAARGCRVEASVVRSWRRYAGNPLDLLELNRVVLDQQVVTGEPPHRGDNRIEGRVIIDPSADVTSSIILGPSIIGPGAQVTSSYIGPYTAVGAWARIEGAEIVRSIIAERVRVMHVSGRIEGSTIGARASIFRDFGLPRAMRLHVGEGVEVALA